MFLMPEYERLFAIFDLLFSGDGPPSYFTFDVLVLEGVSTVVFVELLIMDLL